MARSRLLASTLVGLGVGLGLAAVVTLPRGAVPLAGERPALQARGALHVHSRRSDGAGTVDQIAAAAARANLDFVIITDHGDATQPPDEPLYRSGVLCLHGVEISTRDGHYLALDMPPAPFPLAGEARDVAADVRRLGGFGIIAHADSPKAELRWTADPEVDGLEWLNADSEWRDESPARLLASLLVYGFRPAETLTGLLDRPVATLARWDAMSAERRVVALPGLDAHGTISSRGRAESDPWVPGLNLPAYETSFRTFSLRLQLDRPMSHDAARDARTVYSALRAGHAFTVVDGIAAAGAVEFRATSGRATARMGDVLPLQGSIDVEAHVEAPTGVELILLRDGTPVHRAPAPSLTYRTAAGASVLRLEGHVPGAPGAPPIPWLVGNPIYVGPPQPTPHPIRLRPAADAGRPDRLTLTPSSSWDTESDRASRATIAPAQPEGSIRLEFALAPDADGDRFAALLHPLDSATAPQWILFRASADHPARVSVQLRHSAGAQRWQRSVYVDRTLRSYAVDVSDMRATEPARDPVRREDADALLFVVDTVNTPPGARGSFAVQGVTVVPK